MIQISLKYKHIAHYKLNGHVETSFWVTATPVSPGGVSFCDLFTHLFSGGGEGAQNILSL